MWRGIRFGGGGIVLRSLEVVVLKVLALLIGYILVFLISRKCGAEALGVYQISVQMVYVLSVVGLLGVNQSVVRFASQLYSKDREVELANMLGLFGAMVFCSSLLISLMILCFRESIVLSIFKSLGHEFSIFVIAVSLPFFSLKILFIEFFRGIGRLRLSESFRGISVRLMCLSVTLILWIIFELNSNTMVFAYGTSVVLSLLILLFYVAPYLKQIKVGAGTKRTFFEYMKPSFYMYQSLMMVMSASYLLIFMLAFYSEPSEVAIYNVSYQLSNLTNFVFASIVSVSAPKLSGLFKSDKKNFIHLVRRTSKLTFWTSGVVAIGTMLCSEILLNIFGSEFTDGVDILIVLSLGNLFNSITGASGVLMDMVGKEKVRRNLLVGTTTITILIALLLIPKHGGIGLAYAHLINMLLGNLLGVLYIYKKMRVNMLYIPFVRS